MTSSVRRPRTLRWRLVGIICILIAGTSVIIGSVTILSLHGYLVGQVDSRLTVASARSLANGGEIPPSHGSTAGSSGGSNGGPGPEHVQPHNSTTPGTGSTSQSSSPVPTFIGAPGQSPDTVVAIIVGGRFVVNGFVDASGTRHTLSSESEAVLRSIPPSGRPMTRDLGQGLGSYRLVSSRLPGSATVITGLPLASVDAITMRLILLAASVTVSAILVAAVAAAVTVQRTLRPLQRVAGTASAVTALDLDHGDVPAEMRVGQEDIGSAREVGLVGSALNRLLGHMSAALRARRGAEQRMRDFVADASHELRTPLSTVRAYAELSRSEYPEMPEGLRRNIERIESESLRMSSLVDELLLLARLDSGAASDPVDVDLSRLLAETVTDARAAAPDHRWSLDLPAEPLTVPGDEAQLRRVLVNLLSNASVHTPPGTTVSVSLVDEPGESGVRAGDVARGSAQTAGPGTTMATAAITVADDGPGIPDALRPTLFERFVRGERSRSRDTGSTGLGLAIVSAVVAAHGGSIDLVSEPGRTEFTVRLPGAGSLSDP